MRPTDGGGPAAEDCILDGGVRMAEDATTRSIQPSEAKRSELRESAAHDADGDADGDMISGTSAAALWCLCRCCRLCSRSELCPGRLEISRLK